MFGKHAYVARRNEGSSPLSSSMKDQTKEEFKVSGMGLVLYYTEVNGNWAKHICHNVTYEQVVKEYDECEVFKFIPYGVVIKLWGEERLLEDANTFPDDWFTCCGIR